MTFHDENRPAVRDEAAGNLLLWASGFGLGAMVVLLGFVALIGVGIVGHDPATSRTPAAQSAANAPTQPGPTPAPTAAPAGAQAPSPQTTGQSGGSAPQPQ